MAIGQRKPTKFDAQPIEVAPSAGAALAFRKGPSRGPEFRRVRNPINRDTADRRCCCCKSGDGGEDYRDLEIWRAAQR